MNLSIQKNSVNLNTTLRLKTLGQIYFQNVRNVLTLDDAMRDNLFHMVEFERNEIGVRDKKKDGLNNLNSRNVLAPDYDDIERENLFHVNEFERDELKTDVWWPIVAK